MTNSSAFPSKQTMVLLSHLLLSPVSNQTAEPQKINLLDSQLLNLSRAGVGDLVALASSNHVVVRGMERFLDIARNARDEMRAEWAAAALAAEQARIQNALPFLHSICAAFEEEGSDATVIKSLDHWPDLGSDLDLYTNAESAKVIALMKRRFHAQIAQRSWGDRLACKWNFLIPGLPEAVEIHVGRLGQTGEQIVLAASLAQRARRIEIEGRSFRVPAISHRLMISTLQRMYRHFYFRLCDIVDSGGLVESGAVDYEDLRRAAQEAGIWEGVATYLVIVSDYVQQYRGSGLDLPASVREAARFGGEQVYYAREFLRVPILPQSARLYGSQLTGLLRRRELQSSARLGLLPWLATAALVGQKVTGSDKGIW
jgi:hypothetical protein